MFNETQLKVMREKYPGFREMEKTKNIVAAEQKRYKEALVSGQGFEANAKRREI